MRVIKILISIVCLLVLIAVLAIIFLMIFMDPNKLKPALIEETMKKTGYQLAIEGPLSWSFYPHLAIKADRITLTVPNHPRPFVELNQVKVAADLKQLMRGNEKLQGDVYIDTLNLMNVKAEKVTASLHWMDHVLTMQPIHASLYDGSLNGIVIGRDLSTLPHWQWDIQLNQIQMQPLLQDMSGPDKKIKISGIGQVKLQAETQGKTQDQILNNLNGNGEFSLNNGAVQGIDLNYLMQAADALINQQAVPSSENIRQTTFSSLIGSFKIHHGMAETNDMYLIAPAFTTKVEGTVSIISEALHLHLLIHSQQNALTQWEIPALVTGNLRHPEVQLDRSEIEKLITKKELEKLKTKAVEQIQKHVPGKTGKFLQKLLGK